MKNLRNSVILEIYYPHLAAFEKHDTLMRQNPSCPLPKNSYGKNGAAFHHCVIGCSVQKLKHST